MSITRGDFLRSLGKSLPGLVASTGMATAAEALIRRVAQAAPAVPPLPPASDGVSFFKHGSAERNQVALTFDDGPVPGVTELILDELKKRDLRATFFMIGTQVAEGHEIGNHTYTHRKLSELPESEVAEELDKTEQIFAEVLKTKAAWLRPPFGSFRKNQAALATARNLGVALWSVDSGDWMNADESQLFGVIQTRTQAGSIILCHELSHTAASLGEILDQLLARPFSLVGVSTLFNPRV